MLNIAQLNNELHSQIFNLVILLKNMLVYRTTLDIKFEEAADTMLLFIV